MYSTQKHEMKREAISQHIKMYLKIGEKIQEIKPGASAYTETGQKPLSRRKRQILMQGQA